MSSRSRLWWSAALVVTCAGMAQVAALPNEAFFGYFSFGGSCPGFRLSIEGWGFFGHVMRYLPPAWFAGAPGVALALAAYWLGARLGRPRAGRVVARALAAVLLLAHGPNLAAFAADVAIDRACLDAWSGLVELFVVPHVAPALAALCVLAAVRVPRHRVRRLLRARWFRRGTAGLAAFAALCLLPVADLAAGPVTTGDECVYSYDEGIYGEGIESAAGAPSVRPDGPRRPAAEVAFLCDARRRGFATRPDHLLLAYGRRQCEAYPRTAAHMSWLSFICPRATADWQRKLAADEAEYARQEAAEQAVCDSSRHRPLTRPLRTARTREWSEIGLQSYEDDENTQDTVPTLHGDLVGSVPGHMEIFFHSDYSVCVTTETYRRRPPVEVKGWDKVIEVGYESPTGDFVLMDPMYGPGELPDLAFRGKGHYRVRVHYREPDWEAFTPQHLLVMVYPGPGGQVVRFKG